MYIEKIDSPKELKKLSIAECDKLAEEIREALLKKASLKGGHLSSNLGLVEATIALHYVFDSPKDKIIFDVSHQCYTHKILTGRRLAFTDEKSYGLANGYTNPDESEHDYFRVGHTATSISLASGLAKARDLKGSDENVIAVIGDGSLSGGEAFEGLDFAATEIEGNLTVVFNDNQMSIAENHGGIYKSLSELRESNGKSNNNLFKSLGYEYYFVKDGNNVQDVVNALNEVKGKRKRSLIHICTVKGKGYQYAEENQERTHWVRPFDIKTGIEKEQINSERYDIIIRDYLLDKMKNDPKVVTMIAAVPDALSFKKEYRDMAGKQFIDVGIAEEHAISMSAGLAKNGCKPVFATMSTFFQRTYDQISQELCINKLSATLLVVNASVYASNDVTHIGIFDIPMMSNMPNLVYLAPTNKQEFIAMLDWSIEQQTHPVAVRAPRNGVFNSKYEVDKDYGELNKYKLVVDGEKIAVLALGDFFQMGEELCELIRKEFNFTPTLINPRYITGLDIELLIELKNKHGLIISLEDGVLDGGFGQKIAGFYGDKNVNVLNYGLKKEFLDRYDVNEVLERNHLKPELIIEDIKKLQQFQI